LAWELAHGAIPDGLNVLHRCDVRDCLRVDHLFLGTHADNVRDCVSKGRHGIGERHPGAKVTSAEVHEIRRLAASGVSHARIATRFPISVRTVRDIVRRESWKHL